MFIIVFILSLFLSQNGLALFTEVLSVGVVVSTLIFLLLFLFAIRLRMRGSNVAVFTSDSILLLYILVIVWSYSTIRVELEYHEGSATQGGFFSHSIVYLAKNGIEVEGLARIQAENLNNGQSENRAINQILRQNEYNAYRIVRVFGITSRDGILNTNGNPVNYINIHYIEDERGYQNSAQGEVVVYGADKRFFAGRSVELTVSGSLRRSREDLFLRTGIDFEVWGKMLLVSGGTEYRGLNAMLAELTRLRADLRSELDRRLNTLSPQSKAYIQSLILGYRSEMGSGLQDLFRHSGVIHILVLSGMHIGIIYLSLRLLIPPVIPIFLKEAIAIVVMLLYLWFINPGASLWRAVIMLVLLTGFGWVGRRVSFDRVLCFVWVLLVAVRPRFLYDLGMYLSFAAIWGLVNLSVVFRFAFARLAYFVSKLGSGRSFERASDQVSGQFSGSMGRGASAIYQKFVDIFLPSISAQSVIMPISFLLFDSISPQGLIALPLVILPFYASLLLSALLIPISMLAPDLAVPVGSALDFIINTMANILSPFAQFSPVVNALPIPLRLSIIILPFVIIFACKQSPSLLPSNSVQLFFSERDKKSARIV